VKRHGRRLPLLGAVLVAALSPTLAFVLAERGRGEIRHHPRSEIRDRSTRTVVGQRSSVRPGARTRGRRELRGDRETQRLLALGLPIYCGGRHGNEIALTFDDGPGPYTALALRKLRAARERATFFIVGRNIPLFPGALRRELSVGTVGDHTYTHPLLVGLPPATVESELGRAARAIATASGERVLLFRPPYGIHDRRVDEIAHRLGLLEVLWSIDSGDSLGADWMQIEGNVTRAITAGSIVLMHENRGQTIRSLRTLLPWLHRHHLRSVSLRELFASDPPSPQQVRRGLAGCGRAYVVRGAIGA
jgi:peptidoglycan/xylan/chitin deacetylase (PgdA/CDA1 family)